MSLPMISPFQAFKRRWADCTACDLCHDRKNVVLCRGTYPCDVMFIGEAPGVSEDILGRPMVGPAGHLLDYILGQAISSQYSYAIANLVCCIPRGEEGDKVQEPPDYAVEACSVRLKEFVELCDPRLIVAVGKLAQDWLDPRYRRSIRFHRRIPLTRIVHPAAILRANIVQRGLAIQKAIIEVRNSCDGYLGGNTNGE